MNIMDPNHLFSLPLSANPCGLDPCINQHFFVLPLTKSTLGVWIISEVKQRILEKSKTSPIELEGHSNTINALVFADGSTGQLASSCCEKILVWDCQNFDSEIKSRLFFTNPGELYVMAFGNNNNIIAAGKGPNIVIMEKGQTKVTSVLEMHNATVTGLKFCPYYTSTLVSISDDRTCCVWDIKDKVLLYQSTIVTSAPLLSLSMSLLTPCVVVGSGDGKVIAFDLRSDHGFRQLINIDIASAIRKQTQRSIKQSKINSNGEESETYAESSESILAIEYVYFCQSSETLGTLLGQNISAAGDILNDSPPLFNILTTNYIIQINSRTFEIQNMIKLQSEINSETFISSLSVGSISYAAAKQTGQFEMFIVAGTVFDRKIHVLHWNFMDEKHKLSESNTDMNEQNNSSFSDFTLSVVAINDLEISSPLKSEMLPPIVKSAVTKGDIATGKKKPSSKINQPLTFKSSVKSSGYTSAPRTTMFKPETSKQKLLNLNNPVKKQQSTKPMASKLFKSSCDTTSWDVKDYIDTFEVDCRTTAVMNVRFADDGTALACALSNKTAMIIKSPFSKHVSTSLIGHNHSINSVYWSNCNSYLLTASNDKTVRLWDRSSGDPFMIMTHKKHTPKDGPQKTTDASKTFSLTIKNSNSHSTLSSSTGSSENKLFSKEITRAQFYYMDKFLLVTHGSNLSLYKYVVTPEVDDLKRYQSRNKYKLVENWTTLSASFTSSAAINNFFSHLVMCTTSGKSIEIYDVNKSVLAHTFTDCHSRPPHCITINEGSCFSSQSSEAYNVIATIAPTDPIKLWDLRSKSCVQALVGHHNKAHACQIAFSPCGNYLTSGSEDRSVYVFDLRKGTFCDKLKGPSDVVCSVAYSPAKTLLAVGCLDSKVLWYK